MTRQAQTFRVRYIGYSGIIKEVEIAARNTARPFKSPATPLARKQRRHRRTVGWLLPVADTIAPAAANNTIRAVRTVAVPHKTFKFTTISRADRNRFKPAHRRTSARQRHFGNQPSEILH